MDKTVKVIDESIINKTHLHHVVVNAAKMVNMQKDKELYESVVSSDIINADGQAVVWASKFLGQPLPERVAGIDLMQNLVKLAYEKNHKVFFFGAKEDVVSEVVKRYSEQYSQDIIAGYRNGYFDNVDEESIARQIAQSGAHILFVAISSPTKEIFLNRYKDIIQTPFIMGVGGSFDVVAGKVNRAPLWMQNAGLEWFYRFLQEPRRMWKRYLYTNSMFLWLVFKEKLLKK
ncbi:WecB/TagA/CpsF family glycosyltransferase [Sulfurovum sp. TSL1]|uniref:WecB/TagA/CpsF family glycosyltransferase n=1 Tax=Sulfurovum sp. TSL1 TaxID=2826994 RepID=UPI001CC52839|nr:WecB/TagA/CpsF family glycosyltransferase [Sulfurovum sp. TSL1]